MLLLLYSRETSSLHFSLTNRIGNAGHGLGEEESITELNFNCSAVSKLNIFVPALPYFSSYNCLRLEAVGGRMVPSGPLRRTV